MLLKTLPLKFSPVVKSFVNALKYCEGKHRTNKKQPCLVFVKVESLRNKMTIILKTQLSPPRSGRFTRADNHWLCVPCRTEARVVRAPQNSVTSLF